MIIVDAALKKREAVGCPVTVAIVGAGTQAKAIARTIEIATPGMRVVAVANRTRANGEAVFTELGLDPVWCTDAPSLETAIASGACAVTNDPQLLAEVSGIDAVIEATGSMEYAARAALAAIEGGKHLIQVNAELDGTIGPILKMKADKARVVYTAGDGDQPGVMMNLVRFMEGIGVRPVLCGSIKGLYDPYRTPDTQVAFAQKWGLDPAMAASFADGTKISFEQTVIANGTGMKVARRGMIGPDFSDGNPYAPLIPLEETTSAFAAHLDAHLAAGGPGIVDYVIGARPGPGVFVIGTMEDSRQRHFLNYYKMGSGPYYCFYTPFHLCHFEVPGSVARAVLFGDATLTPRAGPSVGVIALAKKDLVSGDVIDSLGGFECYGMIENIEIIRKKNLIPLGLAVGGRVKRSISKDQPLTFADVELPEKRTIDRLYAEQEGVFGASLMSGDAVYDFS
ncbi:NAD(P)H-dependent oxidoreductase [Acetobacter estunensis]|uniref:NAD(P)H-dependent oxidoreductase n=1 Tax=Acetobacter estunensis TaxID=104097 RepID=UPI001C2CDCCD|nr:NAD(P)-dependent oxidoreductase [Acetobacter estunensis]MBV1837823.1 NAD(P)-dependent oxidoreductase [Acetobacter estunensis]